MWNEGTVQVHMDPPLIPLIKGNNDDKSDKYYVKITLCRDTTSESHTSMNKHWPCFITAIRRSSGCSSGIST